MSGWLEKFALFQFVSIKYFFHLKDGLLYYFRSIDGKDQVGKFALYNSQLSEYEPEKYENCFEINNGDHRLILRAADNTEMHLWLNAILKQKLLIEEAINSILVH